MQFLNVAAYARYSTENQDENSIETQFDNIAQYCQTHQYNNKFSPLSYTPYKHWLYRQRCRVVSVFFSYRLLPKLCISYIRLNFSTFK